MYNILILSFSRLDHDPRVLRQIEFLRKSYHLTTAGFSGSNIAGIEHIELPLILAGLFKKITQAIRLKSTRFDAYYWNISYIQEAYRKLYKKPYNLIIANDLISLPLALKLSQANNAKVLLDAHEYEPLHFNDSWYFNFFYKNFWDYISREYLKQADAMITVCESIAREYSNNYGVSIEVINNASQYYALEPKEVAEDNIRMIHHGICNPSRRLENMIELMKYLQPRFTLDLMLVPDNIRYYRKLISLASKTKNIVVREPVPLKDIIPTLNGYDLGIFLLSPKAFNYRMALPNKFFEFIQARLGIVIWPSPEMAKITKKHKIGIVSEEFSVKSAAEALNQLTCEDIIQLKIRSHETATELCAENNSERLINIVNRVIRL
jgi:hypothetical protein